MRLYYICQLLDYIVVVTAFTTEISIKNWLKESRKTKIMIYKNLFLFFL